MRKSGKPYPGWDAAGPSWEFPHAKIRNVGRFFCRSAAVGFAGVDPAVNQSGKHGAWGDPTTGRGASHLRKTLDQIACTYLQKSPVNEPVYQFLDKKRSKGKPYFAYMTGAQDKNCNLITI